jgi:hypothetical protein
MGQFLSALRQSEAAAWPRAVDPLSRTTNLALERSAIRRATAGSSHLISNLESNGRIGRARESAFLAFTSRRCGGSLP